MKIEGRDKEFKSERYLTYSCMYHVAFATKFRRRVLSDDIKPRLKELILERQEELGYKILDILIAVDYVHLIIDAHPRLGVYTTINKIKGYTQRILRSEFKKLRTRLPSVWTRAKYISSIGIEELGPLQKYLEDQRKM